MQRQLHSACNRQLTPSPLSPTIRPSSVSPARVLLKQAESEYYYKSQCSCQRESPGWPGGNSAQTTKQPSMTWGMGGRRRGGRSPNYLPTSRSPYEARSHGLILGFLGFLAFSVHHFRRVNSTTDLHSRPLPDGGGGGLTSHSPRDLPSYSSQAQAFLAPTSRGGVIREKRERV